MFQGLNLELPPPHQQNRPIAVVLWCCARQKDRMKTLHNDRHSDIPLRHSATAAHSAHSNRSVLLMQLRRSRMKEYVPNENDKELRRWLDSWRWKISRDIYGAPCVKRLGCSNFMADGLLDQICAAAHHNLITSIDDLDKETRWHFIKEYGQTLVDKIKEIIPIVPPTSEGAHHTKVLAVWTSRS